MLAIVLLAYFVTNAAKPRGEADGLTGGGPMQGQGQGQAQPAQAQADPTVQRLEATVQQSPDNLEARVELARMYLEKDNLMGVFDQTQYVLEKTPNDARALTYQGLVRLAMGQGAEAVGMLQKATKIDPKLIDGWVALAWVHTQEGKIAEAEKAMGEAIKQHPEEKARLEEVLAQMKSHGGRNMQQAATTPVGGGGELPAGHPPVTPNSPKVGPVSTAAAPSADANAIRITLEGPASASGGGTLFVFARAVGVTAGPPIAVKRMNVTAFPITFELGQADSMMGQQLPAKVRVEARLDADGNAMTKTPGEPSAMLDAVSTGSAIKLALK